MSTKFPCPDCGQTDNIHLLEHMEGASLLLEGIFIENNGAVTYELEGRTEPLDDTQENLGVFCANCGWDYRGKDWEDYIANFETREKQRLQREFMREAGLLDEDDEPDVEPRTWDVPLEYGKVKVIVPVNDSSRPDADPIVLTVDMDELDEPQDIHIDPTARTVSFKSSEPLVEVCDECDVEVPNDARNHAGDWHEPWCSLFEYKPVVDGFEGDEVELHKRSLRTKTMAGDAPELMGTRKVYVYVTDKDDTRRLEQSLTAKKVAINELAAINWESDDDYDGVLAVSFDVPRNISDDEIHDWFTQVGMTAEIDG